MHELKSFFFLSNLSFRNLNNGYISSNRVLQQKQSIFSQLISGHITGAIDKFKRDRSQGEAQHTDVMEDSLELNHRLVSCDERDETF